MLRASFLKRTIVATYALIVLIWIGALLCLQWLLLLAPSAQRFEHATNIQIFNSTYWLRAQLSKPLSPPKRSAATRSSLH